MNNRTSPEAPTPIETPDPNAAQDLQKIVDLMAKLTPAECEQYRKTIAKQFGIRTNALDAMVKERRRELESETAGNQILPPGPEPWPEPVDGAELLDSIRETFSRYLVLPDHSDVALALWSTGTYCFDEFRIWPRLLITSPEKRCGKSSLLEILGVIVKRALSASNCTPASLFRVIDQVQPTLLLDEADTFLNGCEELRGVVNCGHSKTTAFVVRCTGDSHDVKRFSAWSPLAIAMIGQPAGTILDRSISVPLRRKLPGEKVKRLPVDLLESCEKIRRQAQRWANDHEETLKKAVPVLSDCENDRALDNWAPIFAIAETAGGDWPDLARQSFGALNASDSDDAPGPLLLHDIREIFETVGRDKIFSRDLLDLLIENEESPWAAWHRGKSISARSLAKQLRAYGISSRRTVRIGALTTKGYLLSDFRDAFERYLPGKKVTPPSAPILSVTRSQSSNGKASSDFLSVTPEINVPDKKPLQPSNGAGCAPVPDKLGDTGDENIFRGLDFEILDCVEKLPSPTVADLVKSIYRVKNDPTETRKCFVKVKDRIDLLVAEGRVVHQGTGYKLTTEAP